MNATGGGRAGCARSGPASAGWAGTTGGAAAGVGGATTRGAPAAQAAPSAARTSERRRTITYPSAGRRARVRAGEFRGDFQQKRDGVAGLFGEHERVDEAARARESGVELMVVVGAHGLDGGAVGGFDRVTAKRALHGGLPFHQPPAARGPRHDDIGGESRR